MRPLLPKNLFFFCSSSLYSQLVRLPVSHFSVSSSYRSLRRQDEESRNVRVSVWWDFENCNLPGGVNICRIAPAITEVVRAHGIKGPLQITAFGDVMQLSRSNQEALAYTGIHLTHIPSGGKNSADRSLLVDLMSWVSQNPPPAHLFLISGDKDFAGVLHRLRMSNYNILLAVPGKAPDVLCSAATIMWQWHALLKGDDLTGKHFNHPPDGPFGSWYGNYKVPLENPFSTAEHSTSLETVEVYEPTSDSKSSVIPNSVVRQIRRILNSHPKGINIMDLRAELLNCDMHLDKSLYGYKKFSRFLLSIPNIKLQSLGDGNFSVHLIPLESPEQNTVVPSTSSDVKNKERGYAATTELNGAVKDFMTRDADGKPPMASSHESSVDGDPKSFQQSVDDKSSFPPSVERHVDQPSNELHKTSLGSEKVVGVADAQLSNVQVPPNENAVSKTKMSSLKLRYKQSRGDEIVRSEDVSQKTPKICTTSENHTTGNDYTKVENNRTANDESQKLISEDKYKKPTSKEADEVCRRPCSSPVDDSMVDKRPGRDAETYSNRPTFLNWIKSWWPFLKSSAKSDDLTARQNKEPSHSEELKLSEVDKTFSHSKEPKLSEQDQNISHSGKAELFSSASFWDDMESFVFSPEGSLRFSQSRSREDMTHKLQKEGPPVLRSLTEKDILHLLDLLIAEKKWLEESPSQPFPFRLTQPVHKRSLLSQSHGANGLRSLFLNTSSQPSSLKPSEQEVENQNQSTHPGVSKPATETNYTESSRDDILVHCQKLVNEILREHPEGYNIGNFRKLFVDRYGYHLDVQKLGYKKLASLLEIMPGAKVESTYLIPSVSHLCASDGGAAVLKTQANKGSHAVSNSDSEFSDSASKDDNSDSLWDELGPVSTNNSNHSDLESKLSQKAKELYISKHPDYEPVGSDDDSSESEGDSSCLTQPKEQGKPKCNEQDSSFWQALDSWHNSKEEEKSVKKSDGVDKLGSSLIDILNLPDEQTRSTPSKIPRNFREKQRSHKSYSFVADSVLPNNKDKLIDGILNGIKKADEAKMQS